jgi:hypothetical protein
MCAESSAGDEDTKPILAMPSNDAALSKRVSDRGDDNKPRCKKSSTGEDASWAEWVLVQLSLCLSALSLSMSLLPLSVPLSLSLSILCGGLLVTSQSNVRRATISA